MNKLSLAFTAMRVYRQARGKETSTWRGVITGTLAAGIVVVLGYLGADLSAEQIGLVLATVTGIDAILKIVLPDTLGGKSNKKADPAQNLGGAGFAGADPDPTHAPDRLRDLPAFPGPGQDSRPGADAHHNQGGLGGYNGA
ncbi:MAG: hypothetical protein MUC53_01005 [Candidatus Contendobacter sp.]|jgi:hypothetical protein|nr:hypothetical protein [Candidatus Contendobacter sp.]